MSNIPILVETWKGSRVMLAVTVSERVSRDQYVEPKPSEGRVEARLLILAGDDPHATTLHGHQRETPQSVPISVKGRWGRFGPRKRWGSEDYVRRSLASCSFQECLPNSHLLPSICAEGPHE